MDSTWATRELPILRAALERVDAGEQPGLGLIAKDAGLDHAAVVAGVRALCSADPPFIQTRTRETGTQTAVPFEIVAVNERARRELGTWPTAEGIVEQLVRALQEAVKPRQIPRRRAGYFRLPGFSVAP